MANNNDKSVRVSDRALEMVMRDVLDGMLEISLETAFNADYSDIEIIEIFPEGSPEKKLTRGGCAKPDPANILPFPQLRKAAC